MYTEDQAPEDEEISQIRARFSSLPAAVPPFKIVTLDAGHAIATTGDYIVQVATSAPDTRAIRAMVAATAELCRVYPRVGMLGVLGMSASMILSKEQRAEIEAMVQRFSSRYAAAAIVYTGRGFAATTARSVVTSVNLATQATHPNRVFPDLESALPWLRKQFPKSAADTFGLRAVVGSLLTSMAESGRGESTLPARGASMLPARGASMLPAQAGSTFPARVASRRP
jgi:hypothetical protein